MRKYNLLMSLFSYDHEAYLNMYWTSSNMANEQEAQPHLPASLSIKHTAKVHPVTCHTC